MVSALRVFAILFLALAAGSTEIKLTPKEPIVTNVPAKKSLNLTVEAASVNVTSFWVFEHHTQQFPLSMHLKQTDVRP